jgi:hypothetical protein
MPNIFVAYASRGPGLHRAVVYLAAERDVYGWYTGPRDDTRVASAFFVIEGFYTNRPARYDAVAQAELHSRWSLDEARRHELVQMQEKFAREWLVYRDDPDAAAELEAYAKAELATGEVNLRFERSPSSPRAQLDLLLTAVRALGAALPRQALAA